MGQASSRGATDRPRTQRGRPISWLRPETPAPNNRSALDLQPPTSSRSVTQRFGPFNRLSTATSDAGSSGSTTNIARHRSRINRARSSLSASIPNFLHRGALNRSRDESSYSSTPTTSSSSMSRLTPRHAASDGRGYLLPRLQVPELDLNFEDLPNTNIDVPPRLNSRRDNTRSTSMSDRISSLRPDRGIRSMTSSLRRRRSPLPRDEDQAVLLSRLLSVAAAATAASLMGDDHRAVSEARSVAGDGEDGTFDSFLQALQNGRIASALRQSGNNADDGSDMPGSPAPLNFFRMFRFGSSNANRRSEGPLRSSSSRGSGAGSSDSQSGDEEGTDGRMVPIIIVGIRSINPGNGSPQDDNIPPFLDALSSFPSPISSPGESTIDGILRQPQNGTRFSHRRRASMGGINPFPANYDSQRHHRSPERPRPWSTFADSPSGPLPPPSTPASSGLSAVSSGTTTPTFSAPSPSPAIQSTTPSRRESFVRRTTGSGLEATAEEPQSQQRTPRQRRLSESDFTRFGSGASRRNGVVEPDHTPGENARSWIIYVLGGSYPENHPILTTPSLYTDSPTYEDMLLLSALLGPAKPPVASEADVAAAPGLYRIRSSTGNLYAEAIDGTENIDISVGTRCLVCLCDFDDDEEARRLIKCGHLFHKECIDQWLTTGRNSCPLCRGQGVDEKSTERDDNEESNITGSVRPSTVA
ncbi:hypothetical protein AOQ84DRAFT_298813 [Glonium stellatum]|uniref:RING-type domain-containing protein n=1 Tax=Glonium stellatum TaxID=574774 RepID=A0A8E2EVR4_9PEZI|nr:hypothetical protein AOQ84DRAFT_298813 [Glonium stellatum]